jgi:ABC-2 type transport system ATP-binding protein
MLFEVRGLSKRFGKIPALADVHFHAQPGEILGLIGPNGAGKSTLFECLAGVLPSDSGEVLVDGRVVEARDRWKLLFYVPDGIAPWPAQSVRWAIEFTIGFLQGQASLHEEVIEQLGLRSLLDQPVGVLSKGQRKRTSLSRGSICGRRAISRLRCGRMRRGGGRFFFPSIRSAMRRGFAIDLCC